jgi:molecular chaperone HtpG
VCKTTGNITIFPSIDIKAAISNDRQQLLQYGKDLFGFMPLDVIALETPSGGTKGLAYIVPHECNPGSRPLHKVYLKRMLLSDKIDDILPPWAFFVRAVINSSELQPTASRERFYENETLEKVRKSLGRSIRSYLIRLHENDPVIRDNIFFTHQNAIKQMAEHDEELYRIMIPHFTFPTSEGQMTIREYRQRNEVIRHVYDLDEYRKIVALAKQAKDLIILSRYNNDRKLLERLPIVYEGVKIEPTSTMYFMDRFGELSFQDQAQWADFLAMANETLDEHGCDVQLKYFSPDNLPSMLNISQKGLIKRGLLQSDTDPELPQPPGVWFNIANALHQGSGQNASLFLNVNNELVRALLAIKGVESQQVFVKFLYLQALLLGRYTLLEEELAMLNEELMTLMIARS